MTTWADEMAGLRREIVDVLEQANESRGFARWLLRRQALRMWAALDLAEQRMYGYQAAIIESWLEDPR